MTQLPTLCMVNYDQEEPPGFRYRLPGLPGLSHSSGPAGSSPRQRKAASLPNSPRYAQPQAAPPGLGRSNHEHPYTSLPPAKQTFLTSKDDTYATLYQHSSESRFINQRERLKSRSHDALPLIHPELFNSRTPNNSTAEPRCRDLESRQFEGAQYYSLPPLKTMGETSLTANAELLEDPRWNEYLQAWVSNTQGTAFAYISFAGQFSLKDRGIFAYRHEFEDEHAGPCPRFYAHMHRNAPPRTFEKVERKRVNKRPEFWTWKGRTEKPKPKRKVRSAPNDTPVTSPPSAPVTDPSPTPHTLSLTPTQWEMVESSTSTSGFEESDSDLHASVSICSPAPSVHQDESDYGSLPPVKTPLDLLRLSSPPYTPTPVSWEEVLSLAGGDCQFEEDDDGNLVPSEAYPAASVVRLHFTVDHIEVLETEVYGEAQPIEAGEISKVGEISGLQVTFDPPLKVEAPWRPEVQGTDRIKLESPHPPPLPTPKVPTPPPPKEPTPPPPPTPTPPPPPKSPTPPPKSPTPPPPKPKRKPIVKKTKPPPPPTPPPKTPKCPTPKPPTPKAPTPKIPTPKPPTPAPTPPKEPTPTPPIKVKFEPPPLPPVIYRSPTPPPKSPTPEPIMYSPEPLPEIATPVPPTPTPPPKEPSPSPEPSPEPERAPLPPPQKDQDFLAEMERQRLADLRRERAMLAFEKLKEKKFVRTERPIPDELTFKEYGWLAQFCILKEEKLRMYQMAFDTVDEDGDGFLSPFETLLALKGITGSSQLTPKEEAYIVRVLDLADYNLTHGTDFRLFSLMAALYQKIASIDKFVRNVIEKMDLQTLDWKMFRAKELFSWCLDDKTKRLKMDELLIELRAGGVSEEHRQECEDILGPKGPLDMLDFMTYLPLFVLMHDSVVGNPLDKTMDK